MIYIIPISLIGLIAFSIIITWYMANQYYRQTIENKELERKVKLENREYFKALLKKYYQQFYTFLNNLYDLIIKAIIDGYNQLKSKIYGIKSKIGEQK